MLAAELSKRLGKDLNQLPVSIVLGWMEQKVVAILCTLSYLGIKGAYIGPRPGFPTPSVFRAQYYPATPANILALACLPIHGIALASVRHEPG